jgi:hypothetical protein
MYFLCFRKNRAKLIVLKLPHGLIHSSSNKSKIHFRIIETLFFPSIETVCYFIILGTISTLFTEYF